MKFYVIASVSEAIQPLAFVGWAYLPNNKPMSCKGREQINYLLSCGHPLPEGEGLFPCKTGMSLRTMTRNCIIVTSYGNAIPHSLKNVISTVVSISFSTLPE